MKFDPKLRDLIVAEAIAVCGLLDQVEEGYWENIVNRGIKLLKEDKFEAGVQFLKQMYGGMGSINDLYISPANGHNITQEDIPAINFKLRKNLSNLYKLINS